MTILITAPIVMALLMSVAAYVGFLQQIPTNGTLRVMRCVTLAFFDGLVAYVAGMCVAVSVVALTLAKIFFRSHGVATVHTYIVASGPLRSGVLVLLVLTWCIATLGIGFIRVSRLHLVK